MSGWTDLVFTNDKRPPLLCHQCAAAVFLGLIDTCGNRSIFARFLPHLKASGLENPTKVTPGQVRMQLSAKVSSPRGEQTMLGCGDPAFELPWTPISATRATLRLPQGTFQGSYVCIRVCWSGHPCSTAVPPPTKNTDVL